MLEKFSDPVLIQQMTLGEKISASLFVTALGMIITFLALIVLWGLTVAYSKVVRNIENKKADNTLPDVSSKPEPKATVQVEEQENEELVAVITAAIEAAAGNKTQKLVVRQIRQVVDMTPAWGRAGRTQQMNSRF